MKIAVYYYTRSGNTKKLAEAVAAAAGVSAEEINVPLQEKADILFLGSSPYGFDMDPAVRAFIEQNHKKIGTLVCFGSSASGMSTSKKIRKLADEKGLAVCEDFFQCPGHFMMLHKNRPNESDLSAAAAFTKTVLDKLST